MNNSIYWDNLTEEDRRRTPLEVVLEVLSIVGLLTLFYLFISSWSIIPDRLPQHFGPTGKPDSWGGKGILFLPPFLCLFLYGIITTLRRFPRLFNFPWDITEENYKIQYRLAQLFIAFIKTEIIGLFTYIQWRTVQIGLGQANNLGTYSMPIFLVVIFGTLGIYIYYGLKRR